MNESIKSMLNWVLVWSLVITGSLFLMNFFQHGFFFKYIKVKASRGKKLMVQVNTLTDKYLRIGHIEEGFLVYKKRNSKEKARLAVPEKATDRYLGIDWIYVDEKKDAIMRPDWSPVEGHDAELTESLYIRALEKPSLQDKNAKIILLLVILCLIFLLVIGVMEFQIYKKITALNKI